MNRYILCALLTVSSIINALEQDRAASDVTLIVRDRQKVAVPRNLANKMPAIQSIIQGYGEEIAEDGILLSDVKDQEALQAVVNVLDAIYNKAPILQEDPTFFEKTNDHRAHTLKAIPEQARNVISDVVKYYQYPSFMETVKRLKLSDIIYVIENKQAKSIADLVASGNVSDVKNGTLRLHDRNLTSLSGLYLLSKYSPLQDVNRLDLSRNNFRGSGLPVGVFSRLPHLTELDLSYNNIRGLAVGVFNGLKYLKILNLSHNQIQGRFLASNLFDALSSLELLNLNYNNIRGLRLGVLKGLTSLRVLELMHNNITGNELQPNVFKTLSQSAVNLKLGGNKIDHAARYALWQTLPKNIDVSFAAD